MFCKKCGKEIEDDAVICVNCGAPTENLKKNKEENYNVSKTGMGVLFGLVLGIIGLVVGLLLYPANTLARKSFIKAWGISFGVGCVGIILLYIILMVCISAAV